MKISYKEMWEEKKTFSPETYKFCAEISGWYDAYVTPIDIIGIKEECIEIRDSNGGMSFPRTFWYLICNIFNGYEYRREKFHIPGPNIYYEIKRIEL